MSKTLPAILILVCMNAAIAGAQPLPDTFTNQRSARHTEIAGTKFSIIIPPGFQQTPGNTELSNHKRCTITFTEVRSLSSFLARWEQLGVVFPDSADIRFGELSGKRYTVDFLGQYRGWLLCLGDTGVRQMIYVLCPSADTAVLRQTAEALVSLYFDPLKKVDPFEMVDFTLDVSGTRFRFSDYNSGMFSYTLGGKSLEIWPSLTEPLVYIQEMALDSGMTALESVRRQRRALADMGFVETGFTLLTANEEQMKTSCEAELSGMQKMAGPDKLVKIRVYMRTLVQDDKLVLMIGFTPIDFDNLLAEMKGLSATLKFKESTK